ncbi:MAG: DUF421 domain-containing protein [Bacillota bacterium]|nr:DUF421 domain-containing protein [Bacillota bacterium]
MTQPLFAFAVRTIFIYLALWGAVRLMGKQQIGELTSYDFAVSITFGSLAAHPIVAGEISVGATVISMATLVFWNLAFAFLSMKSPAFGRWVMGSPLVLIRDGLVSKHNLTKARYTLDDLLSLLRLKGVPNPADVEVAVLETNGQLSVIRKSQARPATPADLGLSTQYVGLPTVLIEDGRILYENLAKVGLDKTWLDQQLAACNITSPRDVFLASLDTSGRLFLQTQEEANREVR